MLRNSSFQVMAFIYFQCFHCNHMSQKVFRLWNMMEVYSNNRIMFVCVLAFFYNSS
ncbi:hypothetical protein ES288_A12G094400v1 [Gossypium darwinii]|uniref:Uncharacterized protein n=1 Tax=Gossypium darwinii TaxID=34276 RepID=A0A5D2E7C7_GOSDA|nr:hypothetical protein ES288_A12G094400v1 [Gossypium darwinii]